MARTKHRVSVRETDESLLLRFPYDPVLVYALRSVPGRTYDKNSRTWRVPKAPHALRVLATVLRAHNVGGREPIERLLMRNLPLASDLWYQGDLPEAS